MTHPLRVIGISDGQALELDEGVEVVFGGVRHLERVSGPADAPAKQLAWVHPFAENRERIQHQLDHGRKIAIIASGDPLCYGVGSTLIGWFGEKLVQVEPAPSAFALVCARLAWPQHTARLVTAHGRAFESIEPALHHGARLVILGERDTATRLAARLIELGLGHSKIKALSHLGGPEESVQNHPLASEATYPSLTTYAVECRSDGSQENLALGPGLPDALFASDGTMTKRDVRAITLAKLAPRDGQVIWDIGAGNGSVAIEAARMAPLAHVFGIENKQERLDRAQENARRLAGASQITWALGDAPGGVPNTWPSPDAIFVGGGVGQTDLLDALWQRLNWGGRLVANAVTLEGEAALLAFQAANGGHLTRISIAQQEPVGSLNAWRPSMPILQYEGHKLK